MIWGEIYINNIIVKTDLSLCPAHTLSWFVLYFFGAFKDELKLVSVMTVNSTYAKLKCFYVNNKWLIVLEGPKWDKQGIVVKYESGFLFLHLSCTWCFWKTELLYGNLMISVVHVVYLPFPIYKALRHSPLTFFSPRHSPSYTPSPYSSISSTSLQTPTFQGSFFDDLCALVDLYAGKWGFEGRVVFSPF